MPAFKSPCTVESTQPRQIKLLVLFKYTVLYCMLDMLESGGEGEGHLPSMSSNRQL